MNKQNLIESIAEQTDVPRAVVGRILSALTDTVQSAVAEGEDVVLVGFGTFSAKQRAGRAGRNPQDGSPIEIAPARVPTFKAGKGFKDAVNS